MKVVALLFSCHSSIASFPGGGPGNEANPSVPDKAWYWLKPGMCSAHWVTLPRPALFSETWDVSVKEETMAVVRVLLRSRGLLKSVDPIAQSVMYESKTTIL